MAAAYVGISYVSLDVLDLPNAADYRAKADSSVAPSYPRPLLPYLTQRNASTLGRLLGPRTTDWLFDQSLRRVGTGVSTTQLFLLCQCIASSSFDMLQQPHPWMSHSSRRRTVPARRQPCSAAGRAAAP